jgi:hypothetical protein
LRIVPALLLTLTLSLTLSSADSPQLPFTRRLLQGAAIFLEQAETKVDPTPSKALKGAALVIFWTSERGAVVSARALDGPPELQQAAMDAIGQWKFKPSSINGQPIQMGSAVIVDFSHSPAVIRVPKSITREQLTPHFHFKCLDGLLHQDSTSVDVCRQQVDALMHDSHSTPMDRFTALDQYGLVLMKYAHESKEAVDQFSKAIALASGRLKSSDAEWGYVYWHRAAAEQQSGNNVGAEKDFSVAENSLHEAEKTVGNDKIAAYYHDLLQSVVKQHAALLESENKHDEAQRVLANFEL